MYAVFEDGSRQYQVSQGDLVKVDYRETEVGDRIEFPRVLLYREASETTIGQPVLKGMRVVGEVVDHPSTKYVIQKFRRRKNSKRLKGHRQHFTLVKVLHILQPGQDAPPPEERKEPAPAQQTPASETPPAQTPADAGAPS
jgi:large subunit ribosomal protein L21